MFDAAARSRPRIVSAPRPQPPESHADNGITC
jgi:hypothetical protein